MGALGALRRTILESKLASQSFNPNHPALTTRHPRRPVK
jgi:hypothetical protein